MNKENKQKPRITSGRIEAIVNKERVELIGFSLIELREGGTTFYAASFKTPFEGFVFKEESAYSYDIIAYLQKALDYYGFYLSNTKYRGKEHINDCNYMFEGDLYKEKTNKTK